MIYEAIVIGLGMIILTLFELWFTLREDHKELSIFFFGMGMVILNVMMWIIYQFIHNEATLNYLSGTALTTFQIIFWFSITVMVYIVFGSVFGFLKIFINWLFKKLGWQPPFKSKGEESVSNFRGEL